jgi:hypothetical protein
MNSGRLPRAHQELGAEQHLIQLAVDPVTFGIYFFELPGSG